MEDNIAQRAGEIVDEIDATTKMLDVLIAAANEGWGITSMTVRRKSDQSDVTIPLSDDEAHTLIKATLAEYQSRLDGLKAELAAL